MHADLEALLALQADDAVIRELEGRLSALEPRLLDLDRQRQLAGDALARARGAVESEERRQRELQLRVSEHKQLHERNVAQLDSVRRMRDATAAMSQVEQARKILATEESDLQSGARRLQELRQAAEQQQSGVAVMDGEQEGARAAIAEERAEIEREIAAARGKRAEVAGRVPPALLAKYERLSGRRRADAVFPLRGQSCGNCDTAIPLQRRSRMAAGGAIETCEACGVLLYAGN